MFNLRNSQVAIKILEKEKIKDHADLERINREITILKKVRHPNVVQLYEVSLCKIVIRLLVDDRKQRLFIPDNGVLFWW